MSGVDCCLLFLFDVCCSLFVFVGAFRCFLRVLCWLLVVQYSLLLLCVDCRLGLFLVFGVGCWLLFACCLLFVAC